MNEGTRHILLNDWLNPEDAKYLDDAIERINDYEHKYREVSDDYDYTEPQMVAKTTNVWEDVNPTIDYLIKRLQTLKSYGYTYVDDDEYGDLIACVDVPETDKECADRIFFRINDEIRRIKKSMKTREQKLKKLAKLKTQVETLERELRDE
jgi:hypothetical protein